MKIKVQILTKNLILKYLSMYRTIRMILQYDTIHMIRTLYYMIREHLRYKFFYTQYVSYDTIRYVSRIVRY